jgi:hypothetical protein
MIGVLLVPICFIGIGCTTNQPTSADVKAPTAIYRTFGEPASGKTDMPTVPVQAAMKDAEQYNGKHLYLTGTVASVCPKKGCWITLGDADAKPMFIKFTCPVDGRLIPMEAVGKPAIVEGIVKVVTLSEAEARHYKEDAGASAEEIAKIVGPQTQITVASPSARIADLPQAQ